MELRLSLAQKKILICIFGVLLTIALGWAAIRGAFFLFFANPLSFSHHRMFVLHGAPFLNWGSSVGLSPEQSTEIEIWFAEQNQMKWQSRSKYEGDKWGFSNGTVLNREFEWVVFGDSHAFGVHGGEWIRSREVFGKRTIFNAGMFSHGIQDWNASLDRLTEAELKFQNAVFMFVGDDFNRTSATLSPLVLECLTLSSNCHFTYLIPGNRPDLIQTSSIDSRFGSSEIRQSDLRERNDYWPELHLAETWKQLWSDPNSNASLRKKRIVDQNVWTLTENMAPTFKKVVYVHIWQRDEVMLRRLSKLSIYVLEELKKKNIKVETCRISSKGFDPHEEHPNASGYLELSACVKSIFGN